MLQKSFYITTTLPYVNADPHIGFALEIIQADVIARYHRALGENVIFNTGTDEHGQKIYTAAQKQGLEPKAYCDGYAAKFHALKDALNLSYTNFIRTTDEHHVAAAQEFWRRSLANGDIYKKNYQVKYCVGCELEKTDSDLVEGRCPLHPKTEIELINEENYFFRWSKYQAALLEHFKKNPDFVMPKGRAHEIVSFIESGLNDFSVSRLASKMPWGIPVPDDSTQVMYVWFDALVNYISTLGWPTDEKNFKEFWPGVQVAGKDNLRQQSAMWQGMLLSAGLPLAKQIFIHGFITAEGQKMSKSLGNVVNPMDLVAKYGTDATRYYLLSAMPSYEDGDYSAERFAIVYRTELAGELGNLIYRVLSMCEKYCDSKVPRAAPQSIKTDYLNYETALSKFDFQAATASVWAIIRDANRYVDESKPWALAKAGENEKVQAVMYNLLEALRHIARLLEPMLPKSGEAILRQLGALEDERSRDSESGKKWGLLKEGGKLVKENPLFPQIEEPK
ncbi:MAG: methionine--tRNA ligase [bacterium]